MVKGLAVLILLLTGLTACSSDFVSDNQTKQLFEWCTTKEPPGINCEAAATNYQLQVNDGTFSKSCYLRFWKQNISNALEQSVSEEEQLRRINLALEELSNCEAD